MSGHSSEIPYRFTLSEAVDGVWTGYGPPPIYMPKEKGPSFAEFYKQDLEQRFRAHLSKTYMSIREGGNGSPQTVMHALILGDQQTIGDIAARMHADPRLLRADLSMLSETGWLISDTSDSDLTRYTLQVPETDSLGISQPQL